MKVQRFWKEKAAKLRILLSEKGHEVSQSGSFTGLPIDTFCWVLMNSLSIKTASKAKRKLLLICPRSNKLCLVVC